MVEPFAAVIRTSFNKYPALLSIAQKIRTSDRLSLKSNFFNPVSRRHWNPEDHEHPTHGARTEFVTQCRDWSCLITRHSVWCIGGDQVWTLQFESNLGSNFRNRKLNQNLRFNDKFYLSTHCHLYSSDTLKIQRRHASLPAEVIVPSPPDFDVLDTDPNEADHLVSHLKDFCADTPPPNFTAEEAWQAYMDVTDPKSLGILTSAEYLNFATHILSQVHMLDPKENISSVREWGFRIQNLLNHSFSPAQLDTTPHLTQLLALLAHSSVLTGDYKTALARIHNLLQDRDALMELYHRIIWHIVKTQPPNRVFEFLTEEYETVTKCIFLEQKESNGVQSIRNLIAEVVLGAINPASFLTIFNKVRNRDGHNPLLNLLLQILSENDRLEAAVYVIEQSRKQHFSLSPEPIVLVARRLAKHGNFTAALKLLSYVDDRQPRWYSVSLYIASRTGDIAKAHHFFEKLRFAYDSFGYNKALLLRSYLNAGDIHGLKATFEQLFPVCGRGQRQNNPFPEHYAAVIHGLIKHENGTGIQEWLYDLDRNGIVLNRLLYALLLQFYAQNHDVDGIIKVFKDMRETGFVADAVIYVVGIAFFAKRKDALTAEALYRRAMDDGVGYNFRLVIALMDAYAEAGLWPGVIKCYRYVQSMEKGDEPLPLPVYHVLFKAHIRLGTPFSVLHRQFLHLVRENVRPDAFTYCLMAQAAAQEGDMVFALGMYHECLRRQDERPSGNFANPYIFTIIMGGYLNQGNVDDAKVVYDEMIRRGLQPTPITVATIVRAHAKLIKAGRSQLAERLSQTFHAVREADIGDLPPYQRDTWFEQIYEPLLKLHTDNVTLKDVQRLYQEVIDKGGEPTLMLHTQLLDVYRRSFDIAGVLQTWPQILTMGLDHIKSIDSVVDQNNTSFPSTNPSDILCFQLSIYVDALSSAGMHSEVIQAWNEFQQYGFRFDAHNWNHLVVALVRAGRPDRAFEVVETILLPYQSAVSNYKVQDFGNPQSPLLSDEPIAFRKEDIGFDIAADVTRRGTARRASQMNRTLPPGPDIQEDEDDFADVSRALFNISLSRDAWILHKNVLKVLLLAISSLQSGNPIQPVKPGEPSVIIGSQANHEAAQRMLSWIADHCPNASQTVMNFRQLEKIRLKKGFTRRYELG